MSVTKLYYFYHEIIGGTVFVDQDGKFVDWEYDPDGEVDESAFDIVAKFFKNSVMALPGAFLVPDDPDDEFEDDALNMDEMEDAISEWIDKNKDMVLEAIKQAHIIADDVEVEDAEEEQFEEAEVVNHVGPVSDAVQQRDEEEKEEAMKKKTTKKSSIKKKIIAVEKAVAKFATDTFSSKKSSKKPAKKAAAYVAPAKKVAKAKKPTKKAPVKGSKPTKAPAKGGKKKKK